MSEPMSSPPVKEPVTSPGVAPGVPVTSPTAAEGTSEQLHPAIALDGLADGEPDIATPPTSSF